MSRLGKSFDEGQYLASRAPELIATLQDNVRQIRLLQAQQLDIVAEMEREGITAVTGYSKLSHLIAEVLRVTSRQATKLVEQAGQVAQSLTPTGHTTPATLPNVREALHEGLIDGEHIAAIADTIKGIPTTAPLGARELVESTLAEAARAFDPNAVRAQGKELLDHLDPDGTQPSEDELAEPKNSLTYRRQRDGSMTFRGQIERETAEVFEKLLDKGSKPQPAGPGIPDPRSHRERLGDALCDLIDRAANPKGGARAHLTVFLDMDALTDKVATATLESGCPLSPSVVRRLSCDADFIPLVLNGQSVPLDAGQTRRLVTPKQRAALIARDRGCAYPGCCAPAQWAEAHHIIHWIDNGPTDIANLVLLCKRHHRILHHSAWKIRMRDGLPWFIPPKWIDPAQRPLRNTVHHRP